MEGDEHIEALERCCIELRKGKALVTTEAFAILMDCEEFWEFLLRLARLERRLRDSYVCWCDKEGKE